MESFGFVSYDYEIAFRKKCKQILKKIYWLHPSCSDTLLEAGGASNFQFFSQYLVFKNLCKRGNRKEELDKDCEKVPGPIMCR